MANVLELLPEIMGDEQFYIGGLFKNMDDKQAQQFANIYRTRRKDPQTILLVTLPGFMGFAGIQRFLTDQIGFGILYYFTFGICFIGTIIDLVNYKRIAFEYNQKIASEIFMLTKNIT
ncbi:MAG: TM2 domain-containing protein [Bacteroidetes bacterium]|nr:TM2 domain-containing protein [Bacteroidota bacterium]